MPDGDHNSVSKEVKIIVYKATAEITVDSATMDIKVLDEVLSGATLTPADAGNLTYKSNNETVVIVKDGKIKALAKGTATITVSANGVSPQTISVTQAGTSGVEPVDGSAFTYDFESCTAWAVDNFSPCQTYDGDGLVTG